MAGGFLVEGLVQPLTYLDQTVNQVEAHPLLPQDDLVAFSKEHNIQLTAYSPLGNNREYT